MNNQLELKINDGGRSRYFKAESVGDCVTRAIAIASQKDYKEVYDALKALMGKGNSPRNGVDKKTITKYMNGQGFTWVSKMKVGQGVICHLAKNEVPMKGRIICSCSHHLVAVVDGVVNDTYDSRREGTRAVYGYWIVK